jgi:hypothetical protein
MKKHRGTGSHKDTESTERQAEGDRATMGDCRQGCLQYEAAGTGDLWLMFPIPTAFVIAQDAR